MLYAQDSYTIESIEGFVQYQNSQGIWQEVNADMQLSDDMILSTGLNASLTLLNSEGNSILIKPMKKGTLAEIIEKQLKTSIRMSNAGPVIITVNESTEEFSVRASDAVEDVLWVSDEEDY